MILWLDDAIGSKRTIMLSVVGLMVFGAGIVLVHDRLWFIGLALALGIFVGPAQAASRSLMARMAPAETRNAQFGLFALSGRVTGFVGPAALGAITAITHSQRAGMAVIVLLLGGGGALLAGLRTRA